MQSSARHALTLNETYQQTGQMLLPVLRKFNMLSFCISTYQRHRWLYVLYLMLDANFRLKLKDRGFKDVELTSGWSYFVEESKYMEFVDQTVDQQEVRITHCRRFGPV